MLNVINNAPRRIRSHGLRDCYRIIKDSYTRTFEMLKWAGGDGTCPKRLSFQEKPSSASTRKMDADISWIADSIKSKAHVDVNVLVEAIRMECPAC